MEPMNGRAVSGILTVPVGPGRWGLIFAGLPLTCAAKGDWPSDRRSADPMMFAANIGR